LLANVNAAMLSETKGEPRMSKLEQVAVRLDPELRKKLQRAADQDQRPLAGLIRKVLVDFTKQTSEAGAHAA
jgi:predicted transcriptional regulator